MRGKMEKQGKSAEKCKEGKLTNADFKLDKLRYEDKT